MNLLESAKTSIKGNPNLQFILFGLIVACIGILPHTSIKGGTGIMGTFAIIVIYTVVALGLNILLGFSGLISLGTAGFVGAGAFGVAIFLDMGIPFELAAILVLVISGLFGALIGLFSLKVEGIYLAIATLFVGEILREIYVNIGIFGGNSLDVRTNAGVSGVQLLGLINLSNYDKVERSILFVIITLLMSVGMIVMYNVIKSRTGRALMAMSRSQHAAQAMGISILKYRLTAFVLATLYASFGGILYGLYFQNVSTRAWDLNLSLIIIAMVVVGGFKSIFGTFLGAFIIWGVPNIWLNNWFGDVSGIFSGLLIIIVIIFYPNGFIHIGHDIKKAFYKSKTATDSKREQVSTDAE